MVQLKYEQPTITFPYKISKRLNLMSFPKRQPPDPSEGMPAVSPITGVRMSALRAHISDRVQDAAWPYIRRLQMLKRMYKKRFPPERLEMVDRMIEAANATIYTKMANCVVDLKKQDTRDMKKKKGWTESEWKKHMDYISHIAAPKREFEADPVERGPHKPLDQLLPDIIRLAEVPDYKMYRRLSEESWYRDPVKVPPLALKYVISERIKKLAAPRANPPPE